MVRSYETCLTREVPSSHCIELVQCVLVQNGYWFVGNMQNLPPGTRIVRCMPNTPVLVQNGVTVYAMNKNGTEKGDRAIVEDLLRSVGVCEEMDEYYMDIITGLTGCGPAYVSPVVSVQKMSVFTEFQHIYITCSNRV